MNNSLSKVQLKILKSFRQFPTDKINYSADLIARDTKLSIYLVKEELSVLLDSGLIDIDPFENDSTYYRITNQGKIILINEKESFKDKLVWSIIVPLGTAVIGTVITNLLFSN
ncbi:hypothetical protein ACWOE3_12460 [Enterococcus dispar]|uniref:Uncharacterized protein n=1 Tax=Enterococcus dispar ATCC 51266 TaxID=1139219 RepID=S0KRK8_9ENTE|nr:hypothetical protein [Enterococcus dispar]EOT42778.1 hypothetical protein OMK_01139 [Enterococcus dispar ATCC 51266]EOW84771.1 hypothetical protein I569_00060 [Enterococcus dispar ATCC 51266]MDT2705731.1 hypothetical protein [Enterococcus dispar]